MAELSGESQVELLKKYDERLGSLQTSMEEERQTIRTQLVQLEELNREYAELQKFGGGGLNKDKIVGSLAFVVGLSGAGAAVNEAGRLAFGSGGDPLTVALNLGLGVAGIGYYFVRAKPGKKP